MLKTGDVILHCGHVDPTNYSEYIWVSTEALFIPILPKEGIGKTLVAKWLASCESCYAASNNDIQKMLEKCQLHEATIFDQTALDISGTEAPPVDRCSLPEPLRWKISDINKDKQHITAERIYSTPRGSGHRYIHCGHGVLKRAWWKLSEPVAVLIEPLQCCSIIQWVSACHECYTSANKDILNLEIKGDGEIGGINYFRLPQPMIVLCSSFDQEGSRRVKQGVKFLCCGHYTPVSLIYWYAFPMRLLSSDQEDISSSCLAICAGCVEASKGNIHHIDYRFLGACKLPVFVCKLN